MKFTLIAARAWSVVCGIVVLLATVQALQTDNDYRDAIIFTVLGLMPWAFIWIKRGALR
jgi:hypothetical protein